MKSVRSRLTRVFIAGVLQLGSVVSVRAKQLRDPDSFKSTYVRKAQAQLDSLAAGIHKAEREVRHLGASSRNECQETLTRLRRKERLARFKLDAIRKAPSIRWQNLRPQVDELLIGLQKSYQHLVNRYFRQPHAA